MMMMVVSDSDPGRAGLPGSGRQAATVGARNLTSLIVVSEHGPLAWHRVTPTCSVAAAGGSVAGARASRWPRPDSDS